MCWDLARIVRVGVGGKSWSIPLPRKHVMLRSVPLFHLNSKQDWMVARTCPRRSRCTARPIGLMDLCTRLSVYTHSSGVLPHHDCRSKAACQHTRASTAGTLYSEQGSGERHA